MHACRPHDGDGVDALHEDADAALLVVVDVEQHVAGHALKQS